MPAAAVIERGVRLRHHLVNDGAPLMADQPEAKQEAQVDSRCRALIWWRLAIREAPARVEPARRGKDVAEYVILGENAFHPTCLILSPSRAKPVRSRLPQEHRALTVAPRAPSTALSSTTPTERQKLG